MYLGTIEAAEEIQLLLPDDTPEPEAKGRGAMLLGFGFLLIAIPYWSVRLLGGALCRDLRRAGRAAKVVGEAYGEALKQR